MTMADLTSVLDPNPERTWKLKTVLRKYDDDSGVVTVERKRRNGKGVRGFCRRRLRYTEAIVPDGVLPSEVVTAFNNLLVNAGIQRLEDLLIVAGGQGYNAANSRLGVGNDTTAAANTQTDLQAASGSGNRQFKLVSSGPTRASQTITWVAAFQTGEANFVWNEFCIDIGTADGTTVVTPMLNRKVSSLGTKVSGIWTLTVTLVIS